jgi:hypothetical protein
MTRINPISPSVRAKRQPRKSRDEQASPWYKFGTDKAYRAFIRTLPCCICGQFREWLHGQGVSQAAHVRLGGRGGTAYKPPYSAVPLCDRCHKTQHESHENMGGKDFWLHLANKYLTMWANRSKNS